MSPQHGARRSSGSTAESPRCSRCSVHVSGRAPLLPNAMATSLRPITAFCRIPIPPYTRRLPRTGETGNRLSCQWIQTPSWNTGGRSPPSNWRSRALYSLLPTQGVARKRDPIATSRIVSHDLWRDGTWPPRSWRPARHGVGTRPCLVGQRTRDRERGLPCLYRPWY